MHLKQPSCIALQRGPLQLDDLHYKRRSYGPWPAYGALSCAPEHHRRCASPSCLVLPRPVMLASPHRRTFHWMNNGVVNNGVAARRDLIGSCVFPPSGQSKAANILFAKELNRRWGHASCTQVLQMLVH